MILIPLAVARCRTCGEQLRGRESAGEYLIICDHCDRFSVAPGALRQFMDDVTGNQQDLFRN